MSQAEKIRGLLRLRRAEAALENVFSQAMDEVLAELDTESLTAAINPAQAATLIALWRSKVGEDIAPAILSVYRHSAGTTLAQFATLLGLLPENYLDNIRNVRADFRVANAVNRISDLGEAAFADVGLAVQQSLEQGEGAAKLAARLKESLAVAKRRALTIARTEAAAAVNGADYDVGQEFAKAGLVTGRQWLATHDSRTRHTHNDADGQQVGVDEAFQVGGASLQFPGDPSGPADEIVNCRCTTLLTVQEAMTAAVEMRIYRRGKGGRFAPGHSVETRDLHGKNGKYDPARTAEVHQPHIDRQLAKSSGPVAEPTYHMLAGGAASGKSSILYHPEKNPDGLVDVRGHVKADPDEAKKAIPEYQAGVANRDNYAAALAHEESADMNAAVISRSIAGKHNTLVDGVNDGGADKVRGKVAAARAAGVKHVKADYVTVDTDEALKRAKKRAEDPKSESYGREVPESRIREGHAGTSSSFHELANDPKVFDEVRLWDNNGPEGSKPKLIASGGKGKLTVHDPDAYKRFLAKADDPLAPQNRGKKRR